MHGGKSKERMFDIVAGENGDRSLRAQAALQQRRGERAHRGGRLPIGHGAPAAGGVALRQEYPVRRGFGPMRQAFGQHARIGRQWMR